MEIKNQNTKGFRGVLSEKKTKETYFLISLAPNVMVPNRNALKKVATPKHAKTFCLSGSLVARSSIETLQQNDD